MIVPRPGITVVPIAAPTEAPTPWNPRSEAISDDGSNYERLVALKMKYDPTNFFPSNHNVSPNPKITFSLAAQ